jgi:Fic family protein
MVDISSFSITFEMLSLISEIDEFKGSWQLLGRMAPERLIALRKIATIESVGSSTRIEGSKLTDQEVEKLLSRVKAHSFRSRDEQEVAGYAFVCEEIFSSFQAIPFTENSIKQLHGWLLKYSEKDQFHRGEYKKLANNIEAFDERGKSLGVIFETATPFETPFKMQELIHWVREALETKALHPLLVIGIFAVVFLAIHPFQDGNGRLSRSLTTLLLLQAGYSYVPYSSLESVIEENKESYYLALRRTQQSLKGKKTDFGSWLTFFLRCLQKQKRLLEQKIGRERDLYLQLPQLSLKILTLIGEHGRLSLTQIETMTKANRNTIKKHLKELVHSSRIAQNGRGRATTYLLF